MIEQIIRLEFLLAAEHFGAAHALAGHESEILHVRHSEAHGAGSVQRLPFSAIALRSDSRLLQEERLTSALG